MRSHVDHELQFEAPHALGERVQIADVSDRRVDRFAHSCERKEIRFRWRIEWITGKPRAERAQQQAEPATLETRVACKEDALVLPKTLESRL